MITKDIIQKTSSGYVDATRGYNFGEQKQTSHIKSTVAQVLAAFVNSLSFIIVGMIVVMPTTVIGDLINNDRSIILTLTEASWYAGLGLISMPIGCMTGGILQSFIGRKQGMLIMNTMAALSMLYLNQVSSVMMLNFSALFMGITLGFVEAPGLTYVSETSEPRLRGTLAMFTNLCLNIGQMLTFFLSWIANWRTVALFSSILPLLVLLLYYLLLPESPLWLMNKGRDKEAMKALRWLRGWATEDDVRIEFEALRQNIRKTHSACKQKTAGDMNCEMEERLIEKESVPGFKFRYLFEAITIRPFFLLMGYEFFNNAAAAFGARNYVLTILQKLNLSISPQLVMFLSSLVGLVGNVIGVSTVKLLGKRLLSLVSMLSAALSSLAIGICILYRDDIGTHLYIITILFCTLNFATKLGISPFPWVLLGEVYPMKSRSIAVSITGAMYYVIMTLYAKTYPDLVAMLDTHGCFILYGLLGVIGFVFLWIYLPETEGKTLSEIEELFSNKKK